MTKPILRTVLALAWALTLALCLALPAQPAAAAQPAKMMVNGTEFPLNLMLTVRRGQEPGNVCTVAEQVLRPNLGMPVRYGSRPGCVFLDALTISWTNPAGETRQKAYQVNQRGDPTDSLLNAHDTFTFTKDGQGGLILLAE